MKTSGLVKIAVAQMCSSASPPANLRKVKALAADAAARNCEMLFLPECFHLIGASAAESVAAAEPLPPIGWVAPSPPPSSSPALSLLSTLASSHSLWISGTLHTTSPSPTHCRNTHVVFDKAGSLRAAYHKIHLFDLDLPAADPPVRLLESASTLPGTTAALLKNTPLGTLALLTCYDLRFPHLSSALRHHASSPADALLYPSAFTVPTGRQVWEVLLRARAAENQCVVVAAAQVGVHNEKRRSYGQAMVAGPSGEVLGDGGGWEEGVEDQGELFTGNVVVEVDVGEVGRARGRLPCGGHRREVEGGGAGGEKIGVQVFE